MKQLFLLVLLFAAISAKPQTQNSGSIYPFQNYFLNLDKLTVIVVDGIPSKNFKTESIYACRFAMPVWFIAFPKTVKYGDRIFSIDTTEEIIVKDNNGKLIKTIPNKDEDIKTENIAGANFITVTDEGVVNVKRLWGNFGYAVRVYNGDGDELRSFNFEHTKYVYKDNVNYSYPYLNYLMHTPAFMVFTAYDKNYKKTIILNLNDGKTTELDKCVNGVIRSQDEKNILGYIITDSENKTIEAALKDKSFMLKSENNYFDDAEVIVKDTIMVVATFSKLATGSALSAYGIKSGKLLWQGDVKQFNADHSEYYNNVVLSLYGNKVIMEGTEAFGSYLQIFDILTGTRLFIAGDFKDGK